MTLFLLDPELLSKVVFRDFTKWRPGWALSDKSGVICNALLLQVLGHNLTPRRKSSGTVEFEGLAAVKMAFFIEVGVE